MTALTTILGQLTIPPFARVQQELPAPRLADIAGRLGSQLAQQDLPPGKRIGITIGSRGITNLPQIVGHLVDWIKACGSQPVLIPAMGSHGGASAEGQRQTVIDMGLAPETIGAEICSGMEVTSLGQVAGLQAYYSTDALALDRMILVNRIKAHTDIDGPVQSGLRKIAVIGLGKHRGAMQAHSCGLAATGKNIEMLSEFILAKANILFGVAILENALDQTRDIRVIPVDQIIAEETSLLTESYQHLPELLIHDIDVLIVDWMGKNISGDGMDPNVIGKSLIGVKNPKMQVNQIAALDLTAASHGNCAGIGLADVTTTRLFNKIDYTALYANGLTSHAAAAVRIPPHLPSDQLAIQAAIHLSRCDPKRLRAVRITNTLEVAEIMVSEALLDEVAANQRLTQLTPPEQLAFNPAGDLADLETARTAHG